MEEISNRQIFLWFIRWTARLWGGVSSMILIYICIYSVFNIDPKVASRFESILPNLLCVLGIAIGFIIAMKWELRGGIISVVNICILYLFRPSDAEWDGIDLFFTVLFAPSLLFIFSWIMHRIRWLTHYDSTQTTA